MKNNFILELKKYFPLNDFFCVQIHSNICFVQNAKRIEQSDLQKIVVITKDGKRVSICGNGLKIIKLCEGDLLLSGSVNCLEVTKCEH